MNQVLIIGYVWPEPNSSAAGSRMLQLINAFIAWNWKVEFASPAQYTEHMLDLKGLGVSCQPIKLNCPSFDEYVKKLNPDIVMFDRFMMEEQFGWRVNQHCPKAMRILDTEDLFFLRNARHKAIKQNLDVAQAELHTELAYREIAAIYRSDLTLMVSDFEVRLLKNKFGVADSLLCHIPFMLKTDSMPQNIPNFSQRSHFVTIGNFRHPPNWDAVLQLKTEIWPQIRKRLPYAELHIYGAYPPPKATALHNVKEGFLVKGWAENAIEVVKQAKICLAPLRFGAGIKGKLTEAMQCGTPSITTNIGAEGMATDLGWPGAIAKNNEEFVDAACSLYQNETLWQHKQEQGYLVLREKYNATKLICSLKERLEFNLIHLEEQRKQNFIGNMLQHHFHRSTTFMAQWINAKNQ